MKIGLLHICYGNDLPKAVNTVKSRCEGRELAVFVREPCLLGGANTSGEIFRYFSFYVPNRGVKVQALFFHRTFFAFWRFLAGIPPRLSRLPYRGFGVVLLRLGDGLSEGGLPLFFAQTAHSLPKAATVRGSEGPLPPSLPPLSPVPTSE